MELTTGQGNNKHTSPSTCTASSYILSLSIPGLIFVFVDGMCTVNVAREIRRPSWIHATIFSSFTEPSAVNFTNYQQLI